MAGFVEIRRGAQRVFDVRQVVARPGETDVLRFSGAINADVVSIGIVVDFNAQQDNYSIDGKEEILYGTCNRNLAEILELARHHRTESDLAGLPVENRFRSSVPGHAQSVDLRRKPHFKTKRAHNRRQRNEPLSAAPLRRP